MLGLLGSLSDRRGRRLVFLLSNIRGICYTICVILASSDYFYGTSSGERLILIGAFFDGLFGSYTSFVIAAHAYVVDCTESGKRCDNRKKCCFRLFKTIQIINNNVYFIVLFLDHL